jgi:ParB family transcriptional regulator, chromosome partitioning protein
MSDLMSVLRIQPWPGGNRDLGDLNELADSIRAQGILQPLVVQPHPSRHGQFAVLAGHRRLAAARIAGLGQVPVEIRDAAGPSRAVEIMLVENCQRKDPNAVERAQAMGKLRGYGYTATTIAQRTGLSLATVTNGLALLELSTETLDRIRAGQLSAADGLAAVRVTRARRRKREGGAQVGAQWEPDHFTGSHALARKAAALCEAREHTLRRRIGRTACGQCWETVIRQDERLAVRTLQVVAS